MVSQACPVYLEDMGVLNQLIQEAKQSKGNQLSGSTWETCMDESITTCSTQHVVGGMVVFRIPYLLPQQGIDHQLHSNIQVVQDCPFHNLVAESGKGNQKKLNYYQQFNHNSSTILNTSRRRCLNGIIPLALLEATYPGQWNRQRKGWEE